MIRLSKYTSANIMCDCGHVSFLHETGSCVGNALKDEYRTERESKLDVPSRCWCSRNHWEIIDNYLEGLLQEFHAEE